MRERFGDLVSQHPLFRQLLASELANEVVDRMGALWAHEVAEETARQLWEVAAAYWVARQVLGADELYDEMDKAMPGISADDETALRASVSACLGELARWYLARRGPLDPGESIARDKPIVARISELTTGKPVSASGPRGLPVEVTSRLERLKALRAAGELAHVARATERGPDVVLAAHLAVSEGLSLPVLRSPGWQNSGGRAAGSVGRHMSWRRIWHERGPRGRGTHFIATPKRAGPTPCRCG
jgi:glutamate dehydrogenase